MQCVGLKGRLGSLSAGSAFPESRHLPTSAFGRGANDRLWRATRHWRPGPFNGGNQTLEPAGEGGLRIVGRVGG
jgi:hypothetical protein